MRTHTRKFLDDRIDTLNRNVVDASPGCQVFRTVSAILVLTRVSIHILVSPKNSHRWPNKDKMVDNEDYVQVSEYCFDTCVALEPVIQGKSADYSNESLRMALEDLERCVN